MQLLFVVVVFFFLGGGGGGGVVLVGFFAYRFVNYLQIMNLSP